MLIDLPEPGRGVMEAARVDLGTVHPPLRLVRDGSETLPFSALIDSGQQMEREGHRADARQFYELAMRRLTGSAHDADGSMVLRWIARTHFADGNLDLALEVGEAALAVASACGHVGAVGHATNILAGVRWQLGDLDESERLYNQARGSALSAGEAKLAAMTAQNLGMIANVRGDSQTALHYYDTSIAAYRQLGLASEVCIALNNLGLIYTQAERWDDGARAYDEAMRVAEVLGDHRTQLYIEVNRAEWSVAQTDYVGARQACERAMSLAGSAKDAPAMGDLHKAFGTVDRETGNYEAAGHHLGRAIEIATGRQDMLLLADTTKEFAELYRRQGRNRDALQCLNRAHRHYARLRARRELADIDRKLGRLEGDFVEVVRRWGESIECNDDYTQGHCERVANIACALAASDGMDEQSLFWFRIGALLHDVGKLVIPPAVLNKRDKLTDEEWTLMRSHPTAGVAMLADVEFPWDVGPIVEGHHERWDGKGYPHGLVGDAIPRVARMVCIADVYDALTSERSYKKGMSHAAAMEVMRADVGRQFDPTLFELFEQVARDQSVAWSAPTRVVPPRRTATVGGPGVQVDELTGLPLRRAFEEATRSALTACDAQHPVSLLVIDVDHFKLINDTYGHLQGDAALRGIARVLRDNVPDGAFVGRFAGDEFVVLVPCALEDALATAERLRLAAHAVPVALGRAVPVALTLSVGVASADVAAASMEALFAAADAALYDAKRRGRDTVAHPMTDAPDVARYPRFDGFIAREDERRRLVGLLNRSAAGAPQIVAVVGEAGVGKSALVRALQSDVRILGGSLVAGRSADSEMRAPYWPWASTINAMRAMRIVPERAWTELDRLAPSAGSVSTAADGEQLPLYAEVSEFLRLATATRPFVMVLDDMQWADAPSWALLEYVVTRLDHERLLICLTIREEDASRDLLPRRARLSRDDRFHELRVGRLTQGEVTRWIRHAFQQDLPDDLVAHVYGRSEGNPYVAMQLLSAMAESRVLAWAHGRWQWTPDEGTVIPTAVRDLLGRQLARLSPTAKRVLSAAAVVGRSIDVDVAVAAQIADEGVLLDAIEEGVAAGLLRLASMRGDDRATFTHGLYIEMLHQQMHPRRLLRIRQQVDRVIEQSGKSTAGHGRPLGRHPSPPTSHPAISTRG